MLATVAVLLFATSIAQAASSPALDPSCAQGFSPGFQMNTFQYDVPFAGFEAVTKSFFNASWYGGTDVNHTTGVDNVVGATRSGPFATSGFNEKLVEFESSSTSLTMKYVSIFGQINLSGVLPQKPNDTVVIDSYTEGFRIISICGGTATWFDIFSTFCADQPVEAAALYSTIRSESVQAIGVALGGNPFIGNCP